MNRRAYLTSVGGVTAALAGCSGRPTTSDVNDQEVKSETESESESESESEPEPVPDEEEPQAVTDAKPLMKDFGTTVTEHYKDVRIGFHTDLDSIVMAYTTTQTSAEGLEAELNKIAELYANVVNDAGHEAEFLRIVTGEVQAVVEPVPAEQYGAGKLEKDAYHETIAVRSVPGTGSENQEPEQAQEEGHDHGDHEHEH